MSGTYLVNSYDPREPARPFGRTGNRATACLIGETAAPRVKSICTTALPSPMQSLPEAKLRLVKAGTLSEVRGHVTIIAEGFSTTIECDADPLFARFVAVVRPDRGIAALAREVGDC